MKHYNSVLRFFLFGFILILLNSCQKNENELPDTPDNQIIDMNNDGIDDFQIIYNYAIIHSTTSTEGIICKFEILGENEKLSKTGEPFLFLNNTSEITHDVITPLNWNSIDAHLATFENHFGEWPENWDLATNEIKESYLIGIKLNNNTSSEVGWIEFEIDNKSGKINILEMEII